MLIVVRAKGIVITKLLGLAGYFEYSQKRTDIFFYFYFEIVHRHIQISPPNTEILWFNNRIQMTMYLVSTVVSISILWNIKNPLKDKKAGKTLIFNV